MKISIIIPVYNAERYLNKCLESVINQTYKKLEIIVVNDGSVDNSEKICNEYALKDKRIIVIHKSNEGVSEARNTGINIATGAYFYLLDSDDFISSETIDIFIKRAKRTKADILTGKLISVDENGVVDSTFTFDKDRIEKKNLMDSKEKFIYFFGKSFGACAGNKLYRTEYVKSLDIKFEKNIYYGEDFLFNLKLYVNYPNIELINDDTYYYYKNSSSISNSYKKGLADRYIDLVTSFYNYTEKMNKVKENQDLISYNSFTAIDNTCLNCFGFSKYTLSGIKSEIKKFKKSKIIGEGIKNLALGRYLKEVPRKDWRYFSRIFSILYTLNLIDLAALIQILRFRYKAKKRIIEIIITTIAKMLRPFLDELRGRLAFVFLPPYNPKLNIVMGLWKWLELDVINNVFFKSQ